MRKKIEIRECFFVDSTNAGMILTYRKYWYCDEEAQGKSDCPKHLLTIELYYIQEKYYSAKIIFSLLSV